MLKSNFIGVGYTYAGKDPNVLFLYPFPDITDEDLRSTLEGLKSVVALTYVEESR